MQSVLDTLNNLAPLLVIGGLAFFMTMETWRPYFKHRSGRGRQRGRNLVIIAVGIPVSLLSGAGFAMAGARLEALTFGLLGESAVSIVIGIFLVDLSLYVMHVTMHKVPTLWRVHRMHHADAELDASSGLRAHPIELILLNIPALALPLFGVPKASSILYTALALPWFSLNHSNIKFPTWFERWGSLLMATPNWHRVHHSAWQPETDSNYGCVFSVWDRLFRTARKSNVEAIRFGLERFREPGEQTVGALLTMPFKRL